MNLSLNLNQKDRIVGGRVGLCRGHKVLGNIIVGCAKRIHLGRAADNLSDGNLFDTADDAASFEIAYPEPAARLDLQGWRQFHGFDRDAATAQIEAAFDPDALALTLTVAGAPAELPESACLHETASRTPGPLSDQAWQQLRAGSRVTVHLCRQAGRPA